MPNDPYDLVNAPALTATHRGPVIGDGGLAVSAAGVTDHVRDDGYGPETSGPLIPAVERAHSGLARKVHGPCVPNADVGIPAENVQTLWHQ